MNCRNCGAPLDPGARFCRKCGTDVPQEPLTVPRTSAIKKIEQTAAGWFSKARAGVKKWFDAPFFHNKKLLIGIGGGAVALIVLLVLILSIASCAPKKLKSIDAVQNAVLSALKDGDGKTLWKMTELSEAVCGAHPEIFGEGDTPQKVMRAYYDRLATVHCEQWKQAYGKDFTLEARLTPTVYSGSDVFEINRALDLDAEQYTVLTGPVLIDNAVVATLSMTVVEWQGEYRLLVLYID